MHRMRLGITPAVWLTSALCAPLVQAGTLHAQPAPADTCEADTPLAPEADLVLRLAEVDADAAASEARLGAQSPRVVELRRRVDALRTVLAASMPAYARGQSEALRELLRLEARLLAQKNLLALRLPAQHADVVEADRRLRAIEPYVRVVESGRRAPPVDSQSARIAPSFAEWLVDKALVEGRLSRLIARYGDRDARVTAARDEATRAAAALAASPGPTANDRARAVARLGAVVHELRRRRAALARGTTSSEATDLDDVDALLDAAVIAAARLAAPQSARARQ